MASSTSGSPPAGLNPPLPKQDEKDPVTVHVGSGEAVDKTKEYKYSVVRRLLAFVFGWLITAAFVALPSSISNLKQSHPASSKVEEVLHSIQNIPLVLISGLFCLVGIVGICTVSWKYAHDHDWLFHEFYRPVASGGLFGVLSTIVDIYTAHNGKYSPSSIATLAVMGSIAVIFGLLALNSYRHIQGPRVAPPGA